MIVVPFIPAHLDGFPLQEAQKDMQEWVDKVGYGDMLASVGSAYTLIADEKPVLCAGIAEQVDGRGLAWALISSKIGGNAMLKATKVIIEHLNNSSYRRIEAVVKHGFSQGFRWMRLLDFACETPQGMVNWFSDGSTGYLFARVKR